MKTGIWLGVVLIALMVWLNTPALVWRYVFYLRTPILAGVILVGLPILATTLLRAMLRNLFVLRGRWQMAFVITSAVLAGMSTVLVANAILQNAPARFGIPSVLTLPELWQYGLAVLLAFPVCFQSVRLSKERLDISPYASKEQEKPDGRKRWSGVAIGVGLSAALLGLASLLRHWLAVNTESQQLLLKLVTFLGKGESQGYVNAQGRLAAEHVTGVAFLLIVLVVYVGIARLFRPIPEAVRREAPALLYVMFILSGAVLLFGGLTFFFDFYRVLPLLLFLTSSATIYGLFKVDHFYRLVPLQKTQTESQLSDFATVLEKRLEHQTGEKTLVLVCASGGGIQASGWTVQVLTGLQRLLGKSFTQATGLISSASGGSVGTMYFLDRFNDKQRCPAECDLEEIFNGATSDSLDAVGWGLVYLDLWRLFGLPFLIRDKFDRGTAVEVDWQGELQNQKATLATWREQALAGKIPIPVFNATLVEDGRRFLISPMTFVQSCNQTADNKFVDFNTLYGNYDTSVVTAARLSATFPYVSPICRPYVAPDDFNNIKLKGKNYHVADGGYFDNSGVFTVLEWLNRLLETDQIPQIKRIVLLQINAFPATLRGIESKKTDGGWAMALFGPLLATFRVRDSTLTARNEAGIEFLCKYWRDKGVTIEHFPIFFPSFEQMKQQVETKFDPQLRRPYRNTHYTYFYNDSKYDPPLSWKLTHAEKKAIKQAWQTIASDPESEVQKLRQLWQDWGMISPDAEEICE